MNADLEQIRTKLEQLLPTQAHMIIACSGGPDSQALLDMIGRLHAQGWSFSVTAVGVNHGLRLEAPGELDLAQSLAGQHNIEFHHLEVSIPNQGNLLENAREVRYEALRAFRDGFENAYILTAHTATDQCETMVQRFSRGTGLRGAAAMRPKRGDLVRPLLDLSRQELQEYLKSNGISYACDPSNQDRARTRSVIRQDIIPVLEHLNPQAVKHWAKFAHRAALATDHLDTLAEPLLQAASGPLGSLSIPQLNRHDSFLRQWVLGLWLQKHDFPLDSSSLTKLEALLSRPGKKISIAGQCILHEAHKLWAPISPENKPKTLAVGQMLKIPHLGGHLATSVTNEKKSRFSAFNDAKQVAFDADRLHLELEVRPWAAGDRFHPFGLQGSVKIGDLFTNQKIPTPLRPHWPIVLSGREIIWVVGLRRGVLAPMSKATAKVLYMEYIGTPFWDSCG